VPVEIGELLDDIEDYLDDYSDCEGNSAADWKPNKAMRLMNDLQEARKAARKNGGLIDA
jgi:hypothetical protein